MRLMKAMQAIMKWDNVRIYMSCTEMLASRSDHWNNKRGIHIGMVQVVVYVSFQPEVISGIKRVDHIALASVHIVVRCRSPEVISGIRRSEQVVVRCGPPKAIWGIRRQGHIALAIVQVIFLCRSPEVISGISREEHSSYSIYTSCSWMLTFRNDLICSYI